jgi:hypothetical protein
MGPVGKVCEAAARLAAGQVSNCSLIAVAALLGPKRMCFNARPQSSAERRQAAGHHDDVHSSRAGRMRAGAPQLRQG